MLAFEVCHTGDVESLELGWVVGEKKRKRGITEPLAVNEGLTNTCPCGSVGKGGLFVQKSR